MLFSFLFQQTLKVALIGFACMEKGQFAYGLTYFTEIFDNNFWPFSEFLVTQFKIPKLTSF